MDIDKKKEYLLPHFKKALSMEAEDETEPNT